MCNVVVLLVTFLLECLLYFRNKSTPFKYKNWDHSISDLYTNQNFPTLIEELSKTNNSLIESTQNKNRLSII